MEVIETIIDTSSDEYQENYQAMEALVADLAKELDKARNERYLGWGGDTLLGISMDNPDDNKNIILRTPVIIDQSKIKKIRVGGGTPDEHDPTKIPE